ncbi:TolC family protein [Treponema bryantii]|uniref:TolC family protein n=1 Tax=Treponema bryantii TaxID=163 RepID=UPI0003B7B7FC|nr:TolC family protein [Treponema bryantii]
MKIKKLIFTFALFSTILVSANSQTEETSSAYTLDTLLSVTRQNHPELLKLQEEYRRSLLDVKDAWWSLGPTVDLQASGTYMVNPPLGAMYVNSDDIINAIQWNGTKPRNSGQRIKIYDGMENTLYNLQLDITQPIFTWGKITNAIKLYNQVSQIKLNQITQQQDQLETELKTRLLSLYYMNRILSLLDEEENYANRMVEVSENAEKSGMVIHQDVVDAKIQAKELEIAKQDLVENIKDQLLELERITGITELKFEEIDYSFVPALEEDFNVLLNSEPDELENQILSGNQTSMKMLTQLEEVSRTAEKISRGYENWKPDFALQMSGGYSGSRFPLFEPNWRRKDDYSINISIGLKTTIWDGGKKIRDISRKMSEVETASINKNDARSTISKTFNSEWNAAQACTMKIEYQDLKIESAEAKIDQKQLMYESGYGSESDVLSVKIERCNAQIEKEKQTLARARACLTIEYLKK